MDVAGRDRHWTLGLFINLLGYSAVFLPGILILNYVKKTNYLERGPHKCLGPLIRLCFFGSEETIDDSIDKDETTTNEANSSTTKTSSIVKNSDLKVFLNLLCGFASLLPDLGRLAGEDHDTEVRGFGRKCWTLQGLSISRLRQSGSRICCCPPLHHGLKTAQVKLISA